MRNQINYQKNIYTDFFAVAPGVWGMKHLFVNMYMILNPFDGNWVLVDTGLKYAAPKIKKMAAQLFGDRSSPSSIILTHGHFDHTGSVQKLAEYWNVPVFAHYLEIPFLTGKSSYPPADPTAGGGLLSLMSCLYPTAPVNIINYVNILPDNGRVPGLPEWKYIHTPGHSPGHISLFRESDNILIAGDALATTKTESFFSTIFQIKNLSGPPKYFTCDWILAKESVKSLMKLDPEVVAAGHGKVMKGDVLRNSLCCLSELFYRLAVPINGRYANDSAITNASGVVYIPPTNMNARSLVIKILGITALAAFAFIVVTNKKKRNKKNEQALAYEA